MNNHPDDIQYILPFGDKLREMLSQSFIHAHDLRHLLRGRGVFVASNDKTALIPILTATLLSPTEFEYLCDCWAEKEDNLKISTDITAWRGDRPLMESVPDQLEVSTCVKTEFKNFSVIGSPAFVASDANAESNPNDPNDAIILQFQIQRNDLAKSWVSIDKKYTGWLEIARIDNSHVRMTTTYTSQETLEVANGVKTQLIAHFREKRFIPSDTAIDSVTLSSFTNEERVRFLLGLSCDLPEGWLSFCDLLDIELRPDETTQLPENLRWMAEKISEMRMKGQSLHRVFIVKEPACHPYVQLFQIEARFQFATATAAGQCVISMGFPTWRESPNAPMVINVVNVSLNHDCRHVSKSRVKREVLIKTEAMKIAAYTMFKATHHSSS